MKGRTSSSSWRRLRFVPLGVGAAALAVGLWSGLVRMGLWLPGGMPAVAEFHGALMICGFLGTLISLERAVAVGNWWAYGVPAVSGVGVLALLAGAPWLAAWAFLLASALLVVVSIAVIVRQIELFTFSLTVAAACWGAGTVEWIFGHATPDVAGWWLGFLVLTIASERLELSRLLAPSRTSQATFVVAASLFIVGAARHEFAGGPSYFSGLGLIASTLWLLRHDIALRTVRLPGQPGFSATCMIAGYAWLGIAGVLLLVAPPGTAAFSYDAVVHAITIGFVLSMVFGHAAIILPAVTGISVRHGNAAYVPLALLHASVLLRVVADTGEWPDLRAASGPLTVIALLGYAATLVTISWRKNRQARQVS